MSVRYIELADYVAIAAEVTGLEVETILKAADLGLADSALHAPAAEFDETEFYPDFVDKAAVLVVRLTKNHPLPRRQQARRLGGAAALRLHQWMVMEPDADGRCRRGGDARDRRGRDE